MRHGSHESITSLRKGNVPLFTGDTLKKFEVMSLAKTVMVSALFLNADGVIRVYFLRQGLSLVIAEIPCHVGPCHHGRARPWGADGGHRLQMWRVAAVADNL
jgi:hypothetical protein